jgi:hypothetical protein
MSRKLILFMAAALSTLAGCVPKMAEPLAVCPGKISTADALAVLRSRSQNIVPFRASGQGHLTYYVEGKKKPQSESIDVKLWVNPPMEIYLQGDKPLIAKAVVLGSNEHEFWLAVSPKEISLYCWGEWSQQNSSEGPAINPRTLLEALGIGEAETSEGWPATRTAGWSLSNKGAFDILTKQEQGVITKKMYIYSCDYRVRKIEFFGVAGGVVARAELEDYREASNGFFVPAMIKITTQGRGRIEDSLSITLDLASIKPADIAEPQRKYLFERRPPQGFKHVHRIVNGKWVEEPQ